MQKTKNIELKKFPSNANEKEMIFFNFWEDCQKQSSFSNAKLFSYEELEGKGILDSLSISVTPIGVDTKTALLTNEVYLYANIKGSSIPQPLEVIPEKMVAVEERPSTVTVGGKTFYDKVNIYQDAKSTTTMFGESFSIIYKKDKTVQIKYSDSPKLRTLVKDLDFMLSYIREGEFSYNNVSFPFDETTADFSNFSIESSTQRLADAQKVVKMLDVLGCKKDLNLKSLNNSDWNNINTLVTAFVDKKKVKRLKDNLPPLTNIKVGNLKFLLVLKKDENQKGTYEISDFFKTDLVLFYKNRNGEEVPISQYAILRKDDFLNVDNIRFDELLPSFKKFERHSETISKANFTMLDLISAYDDCNRKEILETAKAFSDWIMQATEEEIPYSLRLLNKLQIEKRERELSAEEKEKLFQITEDSKANEGTLVGAFLLLDQQIMAERHFSKLNLEEQKEFKTFPIYHFWKNKTAET